MKLQVSAGSDLDAAIAASDIYRRSGIVSAEGSWLGYGTFVPATASGQTVGTARLRLFRRSGHDVSRFPPSSCTDVLPLTVNRRIEAEPLQIRPSVRSSPAPG
jgi:hypothetical protein